MARTTLKKNARDDLRQFIQKKTGSEISSLDTKSQSIWTTRFYLLEIYNSEHTPIPEDEIDLAIVDGANDLGCDFIYRDNNRVTIIQTKFRKRGTPEPPESITHFQSILVRLRNSDLPTNSNLAEALEEIDWKSDTFELIFVSFGKIAGQASKLCDQTPQFPADGQDWQQRCDWYFLDEEEINVEYRNADQQLRSASLDKTVTLYPVGPKNQRGVGSTVSFAAGQYQSYLMALDAKQIVSAYRHLNRDAIFSLNIRNYIGNTPINKKIGESAENQPENFFLYNNGISCLATKVEAKTEGIVVTGLQVINGAQTVRSLAKVEGNARRSGKEIWRENKTPIVLVRITEIPEGYGSGGRVREEIIRANNTQNTVRDSDFRSNDQVQENLRKQFAGLVRKGRKVAYIPKRTDVSKPNQENVRLEEFAKSVYAFLFDPTDFSGASAMLFEDGRTGDGYPRVFGDGTSVWTQMPDDEFKYRAAIYWISQEFASYLKTYRTEQDDPDARAALERKWLLLYAARIVIELGLKDGASLQSEVSRFHEGDWTINGTDIKSKFMNRTFRRAAQGVIFWYKQAKKSTTGFVHRNWMRGKGTTAEIETNLKALVEFK